MLAYWSTLCPLELRSQNPPLTRNLIVMLKHPIPKAKRIALAQVYFHICLVPGMPLHIVSSASDTLNVLIRSKKKLGIDDMRLPWKPIWDVLSKDLFLKRRQFEITYVDPHICCHDTSELISASYLASQTTFRRF